jgi:beta-lactamase class A
MIAHSDNTAPDIATEKVGADRLRALIAEAGLSSIRIPESTRLFRSYILGAAAGVDLGWPGVLHRPGPLRSPLNDAITLAGSATPPAPMITRWSSAPKCPRVFLSAETAVMPEQV